jgi:hypothetical protein
MRPLRLYLYRRSDGVPSSLPPLLLILDCPIEKDTPPLPLLLLLDLLVHRRVDTAVVASTRGQEVVENEDEGRMPNLMGSSNSDEDVDSAYASVAAVAVADVVAVVIGSAVVVDRRGRREGGVDLMVLIRSCRSLWVTCRQEGGTTIAVEVDVVGDEGGESWRRGGEAGGTGCRVRHSRGSEEDIGTGCEAVA